MDKKVIFAVAGSGKTTYIVNSLSKEKRTLIVTYTVANCENLKNKILNKFGGVWPTNLTVMTYFKFLYNFCYKPLLSDEVRARGITYEVPQNYYKQKKNIDFYLTCNCYFYSNRLSLFLLKSEGFFSEIRERLTKYFDEFVIDEVQDIAGRDFNFLIELMQIDINQLYVGDFFQHTYDTSRDGNVNKSLFDDQKKYETRFIQNGFVCDTSTLVNSWRCSKSVCKYVSDMLGIEIYSNRSDDSKITFVKTLDEAKIIIEDPSIVKLHYQGASNFGLCHRNWGDTKGEDHYSDVCVVLNKKTAALAKVNQLNQLPPLTRNKLYVAITRARNNVYFVDDNLFNQCMPNS